MTSAPPGGSTPLARFLRPRAAPTPGTVCDMCAADIAHEHGHVVDLDSRALMCACRACYLLFTNEGAGGGHYRIVPDRYVTDETFRLPELMWERLQIPVDLAFFFHNSKLGEIVALYPSPGGATESTLPLDAWDEIVEANPLLADLAHDVEAALLRRVGNEVECHIVPIDACYELVGRVRRSWKGFDGGSEMWAELDEYFERLRARSGTRS